MASKTYRRKRRTAARRRYYKRAYRRTRNTVRPFYDHAIKPWLENEVAELVGAYLIS